MVLVSRGRSGNGTGGVVAAHAPPIDPYNLLLSFSAFLALVRHTTRKKEKLKNKILAQEVASQCTQNL